MLHCAIKHLKFVNVEMEGQVASESSSRFRRASKASKAHDGCHVRINLSLCIVLGILIFYNILQTSLK